MPCILEKKMAVILPDLPALIPSQPKSSSNFSIIFEENLSEVELLNKITAIPQAHIVIWYIGSHGFKEEGIKFYKDKLQYLLNSSNTASCLLTDLTAWGAFHNPKNKITTFSRFVEQINAFNISKLKCISTSTIFQQMQNVKAPPSVQYFKNHIVNRKSFVEQSDHFKEVGAKIGKIFEENCPIFEGIYEQDAAKCYSVVQYVEGCMIVDQIVQMNIGSQSAVNIVFALPNDESKYYYDQDHHFIRDLEAILKLKFENELKTKNVNIHFLCFKYGDAPHCRPYNAGKKVVKNITKEMIA